MLSRREYLKTVGLLMASAVTARLSAGSRAKKVILLRSSWQTVNIGDIGHTPGVLHLLEKYLPGFEIRLWPMSVTNGVDRMLQKRFPNVKLIQQPEEVEQAFNDSVFLLHGSGPSLVAARDLERWSTQTGKPYGICGITFPGFYGPPTDQQQAALKTNIDLLSKARFCYFRDSISLEFAKKNGASSPVMAFGPDGAFAVDLANDEAADTFLKANGLETGKFLCAIPRQRYTPYWELPEKKAAFNPMKNARNEEMREHDIKPIRDAIIAVARQTPMKILVCPEDATQVKLGKTAIIDRLPEDVREKVVWKDRYWLTDEALSTYRRSAGLFGIEMHSPIMCIGNGIPALVGRYDEQTSKGYMWKDIGLGDWLFDMDKPGDVQKILPTALSLAQDPAAAKAKALKAKKVVDQLFQESMNLLKKQLA